MMAPREKVTALLREVCSQNLWRPVPAELEERIVDCAVACLDPDDIDASPYGELFELAVEMAVEDQGHGLFATIYDESVMVVDGTDATLFADGDSGTFRKAYGIG